MGRPKPSRSRELRGQKANAQSLASVIQETFRLWRKHHLGYDQTKYVVEEARRRLALEPPRARKRTVERLDPCDVSRMRNVENRPRLLPPNGGFRLDAVTTPTGFADSALVQVQSGSVTNWDFAIDV